MELKEGMYVRDAYEGIGQVTSICKCSECYERGFYEPQIKYANSTEYVRNYIKMQKYEGRASYNIIDLIEVGDYVNGSLVEQIDNYSNGYICVNVDRNSEMGFREISFKNEDIKSIVTKEQFESISYKVN